jgi:hypothetical protein
VKHLGWVIFFGVDRLNHWRIRSLMEKPAFMRMNFYDVRVIMVIMRVIVEEILCQAVMEQISVLEW